MQVPQCQEQDTALGLSCSPPKPQLEEETGHRLGTPAGSLGPGHPMTTIISVSSAPHPSLPSVNPCTLLLDPVLSVHHLPPQVSAASSLLQKGAGSS